MDLPHVFTERLLLPFLWQWLCYASFAVSLSLSLYCITQQFLNYRKPNEQRLVIRIQLLVPIFSVTCVIATIHPVWCQLYLDSFREFYEAFVIYTFFSLLTLILGGERRIITELALGRKPVPYVVPWHGPIDLSDPSDFLTVKRGILQYVWFKPFYCLGLLICQVWRFENLQFWLVILYNMSVTWSLYNLALFWTCLYDVLKKYNPWSKFLCVKLIIFASYWQGIILQILNYAGVLDKYSDGTPGELTGYVFQNGLLSVEMVGFAIFHAVAFPWSPYSIQSLPNGARMNLYYALRDCFGGADLLWDFKQTLLVGDEYYNFKNFDPNEPQSLTHSNNSKTTLNRINQGFRFSHGGRESYWMNYGSIDAEANTSLTPAAARIEAEPCEIISSGDGYIPEDKRYPVSWDTMGHRFSRNMNGIRRDIESRLST
ncbi:Hfl1p KNAG_0C01300 [Huiozyma naganishii CBS 8797]|uniref:Uncharacterized protein n=1 Tax=Huiozyma naganishii (strain ATCC MYA-139 / BCRC 22969 / CBS 8797 / KCTC 17520 / NBRC 10181 / NCYC 3082 / Yp74L-3) TaxID=1071383 RepID=J7RI79_HUIN7|nr:hypothetical protein KNAG_0C01300 [Kazachstania naganishii CBS 8797]CCK69243.1 hypothetical protein KNAG_0C01300 [Kazachstania naganishii CBS 8797]